MVTTALLMGLAGSLHCVGMCSPLAMAVSHLSRQAILSRLVYNSGRILTYGILGLAIGSASWFAPFSRFQNTISTLLGVMLLVLAITGTTTIKIPLVTPLLQKLRGAIVNAFGKTLQTKGLTSTFILGTLNGLLPCGLTFLALTFCLTLDRPIDGFYFMLLFGAGTLPALLGVTTLFKFLVSRYNLNVKKVTTLTLAISGTLLIARIFFAHDMPPSAAEQQLVDIIICR